MIRDIVAFDWNKPLAQPERDELVEKLAEHIVGRGLQAPAVWMLEIHRPLLPVVGQIGIVFWPIAATLLAGGASDWQKFTQLMREPTAIGELVRRIERKTEEQQLAARQ